MNASITRLFVGSTPTTTIIDKSNKVKKMADTTKKQDNQEYCKYCGRPFVPKYRNSRYCDNTCFKMSLGQLTTLLYQNIDRMNENDYKWFVEIPLKGYNKFFKRDVKIDTFEKELKNIAGKKTNEFIFIVFGAYIAASRLECRNFIDRRVIERAIGGKLSRRALKKYVMVQGTCTIENRARGMIRRWLSTAVEDGTVSREESDEALKIFDLVNEHVTNVSKRSVYPHAMFYVSLKLAGSDIMQVHASKITKVSDMSLRVLSKLVIEELFEKGVVSFKDGETTCRDDYTNVTMLEKAELIEK